MSYFDKKTICDIDVKGKKAIVRVDFNVPLKDGAIDDDTRIVAALPTIKYLLDNGAAVILMSHLGRPKGERKPEFSLEPVAQHLSELLDMEIAFSEDCVGPAAKEAADKLQPGQVLMLENLRFYKEEEKNDPAFAKELADLADIYVNDAFGTAHRAHASTAGIAAYLPAVSGFLIEKELKGLGAAINDPKRPLVAIIGGAKVSDKIPVIENLVQKVDKLLIGGGMANTFLTAQGCDMQASLMEPDRIQWAADLLKTEAAKKILLPLDVVVAEKFAPDAAHQTVDVDKVPEGWMTMDAGPKTRALFSEAVQDAATVVWNGPLGVFEMEAFSHGTNEMAQAVANSNAFSIIGGGDSVSAIKKAGLADKVGHISTGGGASLEFLKGKILPGIDALNDK
ncbi:MAG: phosphoglycerate kinase [Firmicutes bacterium]|nr:phosphoglycerate kinase [Bacillota bacterium]